MSHSLAIPAVMSFEYAARRTRFSALLRLFASSPRERIAIAELMDGFGERSFGAAMLLLALPNMVPLPPGASTIFGLPLVLIAAQMALGRRTIWLPNSIRRRSIATTLFSRMVNATRPHLRRAERLLQPRLQFMLSPLATRLTGLCCVVLAILIALPIPFANFLGGLAVAAFALGLLRQDGIAILFGWVVASFSVAATVLVSGALWLAVTEMMGWV
jgi:hypothetical protein